jgi:outer membrane biosynthesis protein TonB
MNGGVLMRPDPMGRGFAFAIALHGSLLGVVLLVNWLHVDGPKFGDPNAGGASVGIEAVDKIPLPHTGPENPVAHDTDSDTPQAPPEKVAQEKAEVVPPDAVKLNLKEKKAKAKEASAPKRFKSFEELEKNQLTSRTPQAVSSPIYSQMPGSGRVGLGANTTLGSQFGAYAAQIQKLIADNWRTGDVMVATAPPVVASFDLMKDGSIRNLTIVQGSRIAAVDFSVKRAIEGVSFPPLPTGYQHNSAKCEFTFELKK